MMLLSCVKKIRFGFLEHPLSRLCYAYSCFVADHPMPFILVPMAVTAACVYGYLNKSQINDVYTLFVPIGCQALSVQDNIAQLFPPKDGNYVPSRSINEEGQITIIVTAQDEGDLLRSQYLSAVINLNEYIIDKITINSNESVFSYRSLCLKFLHACHTNPQIYALNTMYSNPGPYDNNTYPTAQRGNRRWYIGSTLGGVTIDPLSQQIIEAKAWQLIYQLNVENPAKKPFSYALMDKIEHEMLNFDDDLLDIALFHSNTLERELVRNGTSNHIILRFMLCAFLLWIFANICSITTFQWNEVFYIDWSRSKFYTATCGLIGALMGIVSATGFLAYCNYPYSVACDAFPFLVLGVRMDNTFLMISAVHHADRSLNARERLAVAMSEAAVSITITVLTDILSFAIGMITSFLAVQLFSLQTLVAMTITFIYQLTFLLGILAINLRSEQGNRHCLLPCLETIDPKSEKIASYQRFFCLGTQTNVGQNKSMILHTKTEQNTKEARKDVCQEGTWISRMIRFYYAPFLMRTSVKIAIGLIYLAYLAASIYGCTQTQLGLEPTKLLLTDSYAVKFYNRLEEYFWNIGTQAQIVFNNPGDVSNATNRVKIKDIVNRFANSKHGMGSSGVDFWLTAFDRFYVDTNGRSIDMLDGDDFLNNLDYFISFEENAQYRNDLHWDNFSAIHKNITAFRALVGMKDFSTALSQMETVDQFREIASEYLDFNISTFQIMWLFVDQYETVLPNIIQEIYSATGFMILIAVFFIPSMICTLWVALAIVSIDVGVVGFMAFCQINVDTISMITLIMSIGFAVDFTAHIAHAFVVADESDNVARAVSALASLTWPIAQGAISTALGVVVLSGTESYITTAFLRTVLLVVVIGVVHGLLFLPVVLSAFSRKLSIGYFEKIFGAKSGRTATIRREFSGAKNDRTAIGRRKGESANSNKTGDDETITDSIDDIELRTNREISKISVNGDKTIIMLVTDKAS